MPVEDVVRLLLDIVVVFGVVVVSAAAVVSKLVELSVESLTGSRGGSLGAGMACKERFGGP